MTSNFARFGGAVYAHIDSAVATTNCAMASNAAEVGGGAIYADDGCTVTATSCTMTSNSADVGGGAVLADVSSTVVAIDCKMTSNSASRGGAVAVGGNGLRAARMTIVDSELTSNSASWSGASLIVFNGGTADLVNSVFQANYAPHATPPGVSNSGEDMDDGVGILNLHGQARCDATIGCLPVCTVCRDEEVPTQLPSQPAATPAPTQPPTVQTTTTPAPTQPPTVHTTAPPPDLLRETDGWLASSFAIVVLFSTLCLFASFVIVMRRLWRFKLGRDADDDGIGVEVSLLPSPLADIDNIELVRTITAVNVDSGAAAKHSSANEDSPAATGSPNETEAVSHTGNRVPLPWSSIESSPARFAIDCEMRIVSWSRGAHDVCRCDIVIPDNGPTILFAPLRGVPR